MKNLKQEEFNLKFVKENRYWIKQNLKVLYLIIVNI